MFKVPFKGLKIINHGSAVPSARVLCAENPDLVQLKSLLAGLTLPVKSSSADVDMDERDGKRRSIFDGGFCVS